MKKVSRNGCRLPAGAHRSGRHLAQRRGVRNVEAIVQNNGTSPLSNVALEIGQDDVPQSLTATVQTRMLDRLDPGQSQRFVIQVYAKADAGDWFR